LLNHGVIRVHSEVSSKRQRRK